jgi:AraC-like DNA-binding protein
VLERRTVVDRDGITIEEVSCREAPASSESPEVSRAHTFVFVRRGCFVRRVDGVDSLLDPTVAYCANPGDEEHFDHPHAEGDECTMIRVDPSIVVSLWGGDAPLPSSPLPTAPPIDLAHRSLIAAGRRGADPCELVEGAINMVARALEETDADRIAAGRPATIRAREAIVSGAREALAVTPNLSLLQLARELAVSPHHLSRIFRRATGHTIARHRMRLRARAVLERLASGEDHFARLAADVGFADQSHLYRVMQSETGLAPSSLRELLRTDAPTALSGDSQYPPPPPPPPLKNAR